MMLKRLEAAFARPRGAAGSRHGGDGASEINPKDTEKLDVQNRDWVSVESRRDKIVSF